MLIAAWSAFALAAVLSGQQEWKDTHRVHLRNGNFIDGRLEQIGEKEILFRWNQAALMRIKLMDIRENGIEEIKIRTVGTPPKQVPIPEARPETPDREPTPGLKPVDAAPALKTAVDEILAGLPKASESGRANLIKRLRSLGIEGVRYMVSILPKIDSVRASAGLVALGQLTDFKIDAEIRTLLSAGEPLLRQDACLILAAREATGTVPGIVPLLKDPVPAVREAAVEAVGKLGSEVWLDELVDASMDADQRVRMKAFHFSKALAMRTDTEVDLVRMWLSNLPRADVPVKVDLAFAMGRLAGTPQNPNVPSAEVVQALVAELDDRSEIVRAAAARGIGEARTAGAGATKELLVALENERADTASVALCGALGNILATDAVDPLIAKLETGSDAVKDEAVRALRKITRQPFDLDPEKWKQWRAISK